jgi:hypothetical protein
MNRLTRLESNPSILLPYSTHSFYRDTKKSKNKSRFSNFKQKSTYRISFVHTVRPLVVHISHIKNKNRERERSVSRSKKERERERERERKRE